MRYRSKARHTIMALRNPHRIFSRLFLAKGTTVFDSLDEASPNSFSAEYYLLALCEERQRVIRFFSFNSPLKVFALPIVLIGAPLILLRLAIMNEMVGSLVLESKIKEGLSTRNHREHEALIGKA